MSTHSVTDLTFATIRNPVGTLGVPINGTVTLDYPTGTTWDDFSPDGRHYLLSSLLGDLESRNDDFSLTFEEDRIVLENLSALGWPASAPGVLEIDMPDTTTAPSFRRRIFARRNARGEYDSYPDGTTVTAEGLTYERRAGSTEIPDLLGWVPHDYEVSPGHYGAIFGVGSDSTAEINLAAAYAGSSYTLALRDYAHAFGFHGRIYRADGSVDCTLFRSPGFFVRNGTLYSKAAGKIGIDFSGSNTCTLENFNVWGDATTPPRVGILFSRCLIGSSYPAAAYMKMIGRSGAEGTYEWAALVNLASEVSSIEGTVQITNNIRTLAASAAMHVNCMGAIFDTFGESLVSDFVTLPTVAAGNLSNICHALGQANFRRPAAFNLTITAISKANPAVVTVSSGTLAGAGLSNGDKVFISNGTMTEVAGRVFTVANLNTANDTFQLSGVNSTAYTTYSGGSTLQNQTGPAWIVSGAHSVTMESGYLLSYGKENIRVLMDRGTPIRDWNINFQSERDCPNVMTYVLASGALVVTEVHIATPQHAQVAWDATVAVEGAGTVAMRGGSLRLTNMIDAPANGVFKWAGFSFTGYHIGVPKQAALTGLPSAYSGTTYAGDRAVRFQHHNVQVDTIEATRALGYTSDGTSTYSVTQINNKSTGVTLDAPCGLITMHDASLADGATATFLFTNSFIDGSDLLLVQSRGNTSLKYRIVVSIVVGGAYISVTNVSGGPLGEPHQMTFGVIKAVQA